MQREIKFRAWLKGAKLFGTVNEIDLTFGSIISIFIAEDGARKCRFKFDEIELMQYTGLKDKNGVEIYESDIMDYGGGRKFFISFKPSFGFVATFKDGKFNSVIPIDKFEVIGNLHQTPELLNQ